MKPNNIHFKVEFNTPWQLYVYGPFYALLSPFLIWVGIIKAAIISIKTKILT